jgi:hypothetical protein
MDNLQKSTSENSLLMINRLIDNMNLDKSNIFKHLKPLDELFINKIIDHLTPLIKFLGYNSVEIGFISIIGFIFILYNTYKRKDNIVWIFLFIIIVINSFDNIFKSNNNKSKQLEEYINILIKISVSILIYILIKYIDFSDFTIKNDTNDLFLIFQIIILIIINHNINYKLNSLKLNTSIQKLKKYVLYNRIFAFGLLIIFISNFIYKTKNILANDKLPDITSSNDKLVNDKIPDITSTNDKFLDIKLANDKFSDITSANDKFSVNKLSNNVSFSDNTSNIKSFNKLPNNKLFNNKSSNIKLIDDIFIKN